MRIDITSPDGNTLIALGIATRALRKVGADEAEIKTLQAAVMSAESAEDAQRLITDATNGAIEFFDPRDE